MIKFEKKSLLAITASLFCCLSLAQTPAEYVNTTIGTKLDGFKSGYCVPGATRPFGMVVHHSNHTERDRIRYQPGQCGLRPHG